MKRTIISLLVLIFLSSCSPKAASTPNVTVTFTLKGTEVTVTSMPTEPPSPTFTPTFTSIPPVDPDLRVAVGPLLESPNDLTIFDTQLEFKPGMESVAYEEICLPAYYMMDNAYRAWKDDKIRTFEEFKNSIPKDGMVQAYTFGQHSTDKEMGVGEVKMVEGKKVNIKQCTINFFPPGKGSFKNRPEGFSTVVSVISFWFKAGIDDGVLHIDLAPMDEKLDTVGKYPYANEGMSKNALLEQYSKMTQIVTETFAKVLKITPAGWKRNGELVLLNSSGKVSDPARVPLDRFGVYGYSLADEEAAMQTWFDLAK